MKIKSNATLHEANSPFYKANEAFCAAFEDFIASHQGKVKGFYGAWSYTVSGTISTTRKWFLTYRKSTYSEGHLLFSSTYQNLSTIAEWSCNEFAKSSFSVKIRRKIFLDFLNFSVKTFSQNSNYVISNHRELPTRVTELLYILQPLFDSEEIYKIDIKKGSLMISLKTKKHHFEIFQQLLKLS